MSALIIPIELELSERSRAIIAALAGLEPAAAAGFATASAGGSAAAGEAPSSAKPDAAPLTPPAPGQPWPGQGGIYIGTMPARGGEGGSRAYHLIAHPDEHEALTWGPNEVIKNVDDHWNGAANHVGFINAGLANFPAAHWCSQQTADDHSDYTLPSHAELMLAYVNCPHVFSKDGWYLSSTQFGRDLAFCQDFEYGYSLGYSKGDGRRVRPFRRLFL